jgi:UDP-glucose 4-epimerase
MFPELARVHDDCRARRELDCLPRYDFRFVLDRLKTHREARSPLAQTAGAKGYHDRTTNELVLKWRLRSSR